MAIMLPTSWADFLKLIGLAGLYVLAAIGVAALFGNQQSPISFTWVVNGLAIYLVLVSGYRFILAMLVGIFLGFSLIGGYDFGPAAISAFRSALAAYLTIWSVQRLNSHNFELDNFKGYLWIFALVFLFGGTNAVLASVQQYIGLPVAGTFSDTQRFAGNSLGVLICLPFFVVWKQIPFERVTLTRGIEITLILGTAFLAGQIVFNDWLQGSLGQTARGYWMFLFITWAAVRLGPHGVVTVIAMYAIQALIGAQLGTGFFSNDIAKTHLSNYYFYMLCLSVVGMSLATYFTEKQKTIRVMESYQNDLKKAVIAAEAASIAKSRFLATMSHEIRTPMNGILGMAQMLLMDGNDETDRRDYARTILSSGQTLLSLLNDILDLSKIESGKLGFETVVVDPGQVIHELASLFRTNASEKGLTLKEHWENKGQHYLADLHRLKQMLSNLISNAIKFTATGEISLYAKEVERNEENALIEFGVSDTGIGIDKEKINLLFKPFSQADSSTTRQFGGTGLGLSIVLSLAQQMGGTAGVESTPGKGSRFWFRIRANIVNL